MSKARIHFFLDYGLCFWGADEDDSGSCGGILNEDLPLSQNALSELDNFLSEYDDYYGLGRPTMEEWTVEDCKQFNRELKRVTDIVFLELATEFMICHCQPNLVENDEILAQSWKDHREFSARAESFYGCAIDTK